MARPVTKHSARLKKLHAARPRLAGVARGELMTALPMAKLLGVDWPTLRAWCDSVEGFEESGAFERGSNGMKYKFCPARTLWFLIEHFTHLAEADVEKAERINAIALGDDAQQARGLDIDDMRKILDAQGRLMDMRERAGQLVNGPKTRTMLNQIFSRMQEAALSVPQEMDPAGQWAPDVRVIVDKVAQSILLRQRAVGREAMSEFRQEGI